MGEIMRILTLIGVISIYTFIGCSNEDTPVVPQPTTSKLTLNISGLEDLGSTAQYEGWILVPTTAKSDGSASEVAKTTGVFTVNANGQLSQTEFDIDATDLSEESSIIQIYPNYLSNCYMNILVHRYILKMFL